jgi:hypothetical protein
MVTLILLFIFITPHLWDYGAKPPLSVGAPRILCRWLVTAAASSSPCRLRM